MNWGSASAFFEMGGYGLYVWGSYGVAALLMLVEPWLVHRRLRRSLQEAARIESGNEAES
ncbi:MAG: heme exporter protein CcmD [Betaproteobacteria bacterium]|jgi:heme exporter protein D|nr:heme exporter protein CcmD [Betaproteobacteria bacterium]